jgi:putative transposase
MEGYRRAAHTVHQLHYHFVFSTKYRKPALRGDIASEVRNLIREICRANDIEILRGHVRPDHVHLLLEVPPHLAPSRVMQAIKGKTSHHLLQDRRRLREAFWGRHLWARGYFVATSGNVTDEVVAEYIRLQGAEPQDEERFRITES